jgi:hypothetical protein
MGRYKFKSILYLKHQFQRSSCVIFLQKNPILIPSNLSHVCVTILQKKPSIPADPRSRGRHPRSRSCRPRNIRRLRAQLHPCRPTFPHPPTSQDPPTPQHPPIHRSADLAAAIPVLAATDLATSADSARSRHPRRLRALFP